MDFVVNHVHEQHTYYEDHPEWFNAGCICGSPGCDWTEHRLDCQFTSYMPDVNWKIRNASEQFIDDALWWLETYDLDGLRIDAVKHVEDLATRNLVAQVNERFETVGTDYYLKGETAMGWEGHSLQDNQDQYGTINAYMGEDGLDGQADFVLYHAVVDNVFVSGNENYMHLDYWTNRSQDQYLDGSIMVPYVGSHDVPRLTSRADTGTNDAFNQWAEDGLPGQPGDVSAYNAAMQAYGWLLTTPGAPLLYYGDEYGEYGGADPDNRHMYRNESSWSDMETQLFENISELGKLRSESIALQRGEYSTRLAMSNLLVYNMTHGDQVMSVVLNRGAPTTVGGFESNDIVRFGDSSMFDGTLSVGAHSVTVIELDADIVVAPIYGCIDSTATNFDASATEDDGSCEYPPEPILGCTDSTATNFDVEATQDDGSCQYETDPCADVFCDACPDGWITMPAEEGECCPSCQEPTGNNQTNTTTETNETTNETSSTNETQSNQTNGTDGNESDMQTCDLCCGETYEHPADQPCPVAACAPCETTETSDSKSSAITLTRTLLVGGIIVVALILGLSGRNKRLQGDESFEIDLDDQEN